jgi:hypothetical protein
VQNEILTKNEEMIIHIACQTTHSLSLIHLWQFCGMANVLGYLGASYSTHKICTEDYVLEKTVVFLKLFELTELYGYLFLN